MQTGVKIAFFDKLRSLLLTRLTAENLCPSAAMVHVYIAGGGICGVINNVGRGGSMLSTAYFSVTCICETEHRMLAVR